jgi:hypothetical protein
MLVGCAASGVVERLQKYSTSDLAALIPQLLQVNITISPITRLV